MGQTQPHFAYFRSYLTLQGQKSINLILNYKSIDVVPGSQTGGERWKAQTNPLSYGGTPISPPNLGSKSFVCLE